MRHQSHIVAGTMLLSLVASGIAFAAPEAAPAAATATTDCLAKPKDETPPGGHWYYRTDRTTKRKCWFVADASTKSAKVATTKPAQSATSATSAKDVPPSVSNARAEMQSPNATPDDEKLQDSIWPPLTDTTAADSTHTDASDNAASPLGATLPAPAQDAAAAAPASDTTLLAQPATSAAPDFKPASNSNNIATPTAQVAAPPPLALAAASEPAPATGTGSMPTLLAALACALGAAAILGGIVMRFSDRPRASQTRAELRPRHREIWSDIATDEMPKSYRAMTPPTNPDGIAHAPRDSDEPDQDIEQLLGKASRRRAA